MILRKRRAVPKAAVYAVLFLLIFWALRTLRFLHSALDGALNSEVDEEVTDPGDDDSSRFGVHNGDDDDEDLGSRDHDDIDGRVDATEGGASKRETRSNRGIAGSFVFHASKDKSYWAIVLRKHRSFTEANSWLDGQVTWFLGASCAVKSESKDDRLKISEREYAPKLLFEDDVSRYSAFASKVTKLARSAGGRCLTPDDFMPRPIRSNDRELLARYGSGDVVILRERGKRHVGRVTSVSEALGALDVSDNVFVQTLVQQPLLVNGKRFNIRTWLVSVRPRTPLLAYFGWGDVGISSVDYKMAEETPDAFIPTRRGECLDDYLNVGLPPFELFSAHLKRVALFVFTALAESTVLIQSHVLQEPVCFDYEVDRNGKFWLVGLERASLCGEIESPAAKCLHSSNIADAADLLLEFESNESSFSATKVYKSLELLVDEKSFSTAAQELCFGQHSPYEQYLAQRQQLERKIWRTVIREDGFPKTKYWEPSDKPAFNCMKCGYPNDAQSSYCDVCGSRLRSDNEHDDGHRMGHIDKLDVPGSYRARLTALFEKFDPPRLQSVDVLLERYRGEEDTLIMRLTRQYEVLSQRSLT